jgi:predicted RNase H-like HicB family nuclease
MEQETREDTLMQAYLSGRYREVLTETILPGGEKAWVARYPSIPGCVAQASSPQAALSALRRLREPYLRALRERGLNLPPPDYLGAPRVTVRAVLVQRGDSPVSFVSDEYVEDPQLALQSDDADRRATTYTGQMAVGV